jgi:hypothetical protein
MAKMALSPEDALTVFNKEGEKDAREIFGILEYLVKTVENMNNSVKGLPRLMLEIQQIKCPYLFKFVSQTDFDDLCTPSPDSTNSSNLEIISSRLNKANKYLEGVHESIEWIEAPTEEKKKGLKERLKKAFKSKKTENVYLQLLDGISFLPVLTYKIEVNNYTEKERRYAQLAADMCTVGIKVAIVLNTAGMIASAFGIPMINIPKKQLEGIKTLLEQVTSDKGISPEFTGAQNGGLKSGSGLADFRCYLEQLDKNNQICRYNDKPMVESEVKDKTWENYLCPNVVKDENGEDRITWVDNKKPILH